MGAIGGLIVLVAAAAVLWLGLAALVWVYRPSRALAGEAIRMLPDLVRLVRSIAADRATPRRVKVGLWCLLAYLVGPIDLIPDFIPGLGSLDDLALGALVLRWAGRQVGLDVLEAHWTGSPAGFELLRRLLGVQPGSA